MARKTSEKPAAVNGRLVPLLSELAEGQGFARSRLEGVKFMRSVTHVPRSPIAYEPCIVIVAQGTKRGHLGGREFVYDANNYLVMTSPMPFECETVGSPDAPLLGVAIGISPTTVAEILLQLDRPASPVSPKAVESTAMTEDITEVAARLLESLRSEESARVLGPQIVRELTYRVLCGALGDNLRALAAPHTHFGQITRVLNRIHSDYARAYDMGTLAEEAGMSVSTFHSHFKAVTASSPLQYLKNIRLHKARMLMVQEGANAGVAALRVGYESASQFSREFKRLFGEGPAAEAARLRRELVRLA